MNKVSSILFLFISSYFFMASSTYAYSTKYVPQSDSYLDVSLQDAIKIKSAEKKYTSSIYKEKTIQGVSNYSGGHAESFNDIDYSPDNNINPSTSLSAEIGKQSPFVADLFGDDLPKILKGISKKDMKNPLKLVESLSSNCWNMMDEVMPQINNTNRGNLDPNTQSALNGFGAIMDRYNQAYGGN